MDLKSVGVISLAIDASVVLLLGLIWLGALAFLRFKKGKTSVYLLFFTIFYVYLCAVLDYTLYQFQSLLILKHFVPGIMVQGEMAEKSVNLVPLVSLTLQDTQTSLLNLLLFIPFGFGLPFITDLRLRKVVVVGTAFSVAIELVQLISGLIAGVTFRVADINDVIFNTAGVALGYMLCVALLRLSRRMPFPRQLSANPILRYVEQRPQTDNTDR